MLTPPPLFAVIEGARNDFIYLRELVDPDQGANNSRLGSKDFIRDDQASAVRSPPRCESSTSCFTEATAGPPINRRAQTFLKLDTWFVRQ